MTILFFLFSLILLWTALNLYFPLYRYSPLNIISFITGWLIGELAIHHIIYQVFLVSIFVWGGAVDGLLGAMGFIFCVCSWMILGYFHFTGHRAKSEVNLALQRSLGPDYQSTIPQEFFDRFPLTPNYKKIVRPFPLVDKKKVDVLKHIRFGSNGQRLDIYQRKNSVQNNSADKSPMKKAPVLLQIHGGGWTAKLGSKNEQGIPLMTHMAERGWICVANSYRLSPKATFPDHISDCKEALVWIRNHIEEYGGDPDFVVVTGGSAGGHLASLMALTENDPAFQIGFEDQDTSIQGAVAFYGIYDFTDELKLPRNKGLLQLIRHMVMKLPYKDHEEQYRQASPLHRITPQAPPFMVIHGDKDSLVAVEDAQAFSGKLAEKSENHVVYAEISGAQHAFDVFPSLRSEHVKHGVEKFLTWTYSRYLQKNQPEDNAKATAIPQSV